MAQLPPPTSPSSDNSKPTTKTGPKCSSVALVTLSSTILLSLSLLILSTPRTTFTPLTQTHAFSGNATCVLYDRPPRTGSTTISSTLTGCIKSKGYVHPRGFGRVNRTQAVRFMLSSSSNNLALTGPHIYISPDDVQRIKQRCGSLLFITSTSPMKDRIFSMVKFRMLSKNGNSTISEEHLKRIQNSLNLDIEKPENFLEAYPYIDANEQPISIKPSDALHPDYVVRSTHMSEDFLPLLHALGCTANFSSNNIHTFPFDKERLLSNVTLKHGDYRYRTLSKLAEEANAQGLKKALLF